MWASCVDQPIAAAVLVTVDFYSVVRAGVRGRGSLQVDGDIEPGSAGRDLSASDIQVGAVFHPLCSEGPLEQQDVKVIADGASLGGGAARGSIGDEAVDRSGR